MNILGKSQEFKINVERYSFKVCVLMNDVMKNINKKHK